MATFFNILVADNGLSEDPAFNKSVVVAFRNSDGFIGFNIAGQRGKIPVYTAGPMSIGPFLAVLLSATDHWTLVERGLIKTELIPIGDSGYGIAFVEGGKAQQVNEEMAEKVMLLDGHAGWDAEQLRQEITTYRWWHPTAASLTELLALPASERWAMASQKRPG